MSEHNHGHVHGPDCKPKTATEEAMLRLMQGIQSGEDELAKVRWYEVSKKYRIQGVLAGLTTALMLLDNLDRKYNNDNGDFN